MNYFEDLTIGLFLKMVKFIGKFKFLDMWAIVSPSKNLYLLVFSSKITDTGCIFLDFLKLFNIFSEMFILFEKSNKS